MHPHAYLLRAGLHRATMAPNDDRGSESYDDEFDDNEGGGGEDEFDEEDPDLDEEQDPDEELDEEHEEPSQHQRQSSRGESRQARLARENRELRDRQDQLQRDLDAIRNGGGQRQQQGETQEQLQARLAAMDPVERVAEIQRLTTQNTTAMIGQLQFQIADTNDQTSFNGLMARNPTLSKHADEVEKRLKQYRQQGMNIPRADVLKHILGEKAMESAGRSRSKAQRQADSRREAQRARPGGGRSDGGREGRQQDSSKAARDKRLENMKI